MRARIPHTPTRPGSTWVHAPPCRIWVCLWACLLTRAYALPSLVRGTSSCTLPDQGRCLIRAGHEHEHSTSPWSCPMWTTCPLSWAYAQPLPPIPLCHRAYAPRPHRTPCATPGSGHITRSGHGHGPAPGLPPPCPLAGRPQWTGCGTTGMQHPPWSGHVPTPAPGLPPWPAPWPAPGLPCPWWWPPLVACPGLPPGLPIPLPWPAPGGVPGGLPWWWQCGGGPGGAQQDRQGRAADGLRHTSSGRAGGSGWVAAQGSPLWMSTLDGSSSRPHGTRLRVRHRRGE